MAQAVYQKKMDDLLVAFNNADSDNTGKLTEDQFKQFVQLGFKKPCPDGMYSYLCTHFAVAPADGLTWDHALQIWKQSNPAPKGSDLKSKTPAPIKSPNSSNSPTTSNKSKSPQPNSSTTRSPASGTGQPTMSSIGRASTDRSRRGITRNLGDDGTLASNKDGNLRTRSPSPAGDRITANHRRDTSLSGSRRNRSYRDISGPASSAINEKNNTQIGTEAGGGGHSRVLSGSLDSDLSDAPSETFSRSTSLRTDRKRSSTLRRNKSTLPSLDRRPSNQTGFASGGGLSGAEDASSMVVQMIEQKLKTAQKQLKEERKKLKKLDETNSHLLSEHEKLKQKLSDVELKNKKLEKELKKEKDDARKFRAMVEDDRNSITHLRSQLKSTGSERDEAFKLLRKMEEQHEAHLGKLKKKHTDELEKQSNGFLQTLGVDPSSGKGVREVIQELKDSNINLNDQVDMLAETLARKEQSLIHALQVLDEVNQMKSRRGSAAVGDDAKQVELATAKLSKRASIAENFKNNVIQGLAKNGKNGVTPGNPNNKNGNNKARSPLPAPPVNRRKFSNPKPMHTADFYRHASSPRYYSNLNQIQNTNFHKNSSLNKKPTTNTQGSTKSKEKSMEMLNNGLVNDVVKSQDAIDELKTANNTLVDQVMNLQRQLDDMHRTSQIFLKKNDMHPTGQGSQIGTIKEEQNGKVINHQSHPSQTSTHSRESEDLP